MSFANEPMRVNVPPGSAPTVFAPPISQTPRVKKGVSLIIVGILGVLLLLTVGLFAAYILLRTTTNKSSSVFVSLTPTVSPAISKTDTPTDETATLKEKLANLNNKCKTGRRKNRICPLKHFRRQNRRLIRRVPIRRVMDFLH